MSYPRPSWSRVVPVPVLFRVPGCYPFPERGVECVAGRVLDDLFGVEYARLGYVVLEHDCRGLRRVRENVGDPRRVAPVQGCFGLVFLVLEMVEGAPRDLQQVRPGGSSALKIGYLGDVQLRDRK